MTISERLFAIMNEQNVSMPDLSRMTGLSRHTIFDWQRRGTNPGADKIMILCEALNITPEELLMGTLAFDENEAGAADNGKTEAGVIEASAAAENAAEAASDSSVGIAPDSIEAQILAAFRGFSDEQKRRMLAYVSMLQNAKK